jgi:hypothetical protein
MAEIAWYFCILTPFKRKWQNRTDRKKNDEISSCCSRKTQHLKLSPIINAIFKKYILNELA